MENIDKEINKKPENLIFFLDGKVEKNFSSYDEKIAIFDNKPLEKVVLNEEFYKRYKNSQNHHIHFSYIVL